MNEEQTETEPETKGHTENTTLAVFSFGEHEVRVAGTREGPLFCAADVCEALDLEQVAAALRGHPEDEKGMETFHTPGGEQRMLCVTEPGLYRLIFRSYKPKAEEFRKWVFREVLPALRNTGRYAVPGVLGEAADVEGRVATFLRVMEALVKLGAKPVPAGERALKWLPVLMAGHLLPSAEDKAMGEAEQLLGMVTETAEGQGSNYVEVSLGRLRELAAEQGLMEEQSKGVERGAATRFGRCLRKLHGAVIETGTGQWEARHRAGSRHSTWVLRRVKAA